MQSTQFGELKFLYREDTDDLDNLKQTIAHTFFLRYIPDYQPAPDHIIMDIGAHIGSFTILMAAKVPKGKIYAFEPCSENAGVLEENVKLNQLCNVLVCKLALSGSKGSSRLYLTKHTAGHSITKARSENYEIVPTTTLAAFMEEHAISHCHLAKVNCEGAEFEIFINTPREFLARIGTMVMMIHQDLSDKYTVAELVGHLQQSGFTIEMHPVHSNTQRGMLIARNTGLSAHPDLANKMAQAISSMAQGLQMLQRCTDALTSRVQDINCRLERLEQTGKNKKERQ
jgi:FkbM family methyltransferase